MNLKQLGILGVLVVLLGGAGLVLYRNQNAAWKGGNAEMGQKLLGDFPVNDVARISFKRGTNELNLVRKNDLWCVQERHDYPANYSQIRDFLLKVQALKIVQSEKVGPSQLVPLHLAPPGQGTNSALEVEFKDQNDKSIKAVWLASSISRSPASHRPSARTIPAGPTDAMSKPGVPIRLRLFPTRLRTPSRRQRRG